MDQSPKAKSIQQEIAALEYIDDIIQFTGNL